MSLTKKEKEYSKKYHKKWRQDPANVAKMREVTRRARARKRAMVIAAKNRPCADCHKCFHHSVMDLDHRPNEVKLFTVAADMYHVGYAVLEAEIAKCDVRCSNCHRVKTWNRGHPEEQII